MKKIILLIIVLLIGAGYLFISSKTVEAPRVEDEQVKNTEIKTLVFSSSTNEIIKDFYNVKFDFPVTENEKINTEINKVVFEQINVFEKDALEFGPFPGGADRPYTLFANFQSHLGEKYDTFVFLISLDFGGAHPNHFYKTLTFDKNSDLISFEELLKREFTAENSLQKISDLTKSKLAEKLGENKDQKMIDAGAGPLLNNFRNFYIEKDEVVLLFEPYAVAPYAYSSQEARIKFSEIN